MSVCTKPIQYVCAQESKVLTIAKNEQNQELPFSNGLNRREPVPHIIWSNQSGTDLASLQQHV